MDDPYSLGNMGIPGEILLIVPFCRINNYICT